MSFLFKNHSHAKVIYLSIRWYKVGFSNNTGVRKQNTHTHTHTHSHTRTKHSEKDNTGKG